jgi:hypothetical protein
VPEGGFECLLEVLVGGKLGIEFDGLLLYQRPCLMLRIMLISACGGFGCDFMRIVARRLMMAEDAFLARHWTTILGVDFAMSTHSFSCEQPLPPQTPD